MQSEGGWILQVLVDAHVGCAVPAGRYAEKVNLPCVRILGKPQALAGGRLDKNLFARCQAWFCGALRRWRRVASMEMKAIGLCVVRSKMMFSR